MEIGEKAEKEDGPSCGSALPRIPRHGSRSKVSGFSRRRRSGAPPCCLREIPLCNDHHQLTTRASTARVESREAPTGQFSREKHRQGVGNAPTTTSCPQQATPAGELRSVTAHVVGSLHGERRAFAIIKPSPWVNAPSSSSSGTNGSSSGSVAAAAVGSRLFRRRAFAIIRPSPCVNAPSSYYQGRDGGEGRNSDCWLAWRRRGDRAEIRIAPPPPVRTGDSSMKMLHLPS